MAAVAAAAVLLGACNGKEKAAPAGVVTPSTLLGGSAEAGASGLTTSTLASTTTTALPATTTTTQPPLLGTAGAIPQLTRVLGAGAKGDDVKAVEQRLADLRFDPGPVDGTFDAKTGQAVLSFQKQTGLPRTSRVDGATQSRLNSAGLGTPMIADGEGDRVEVDLSRQVLQIWKGGQLFRVLGVSTGSGRHYCDTNDQGKTSCGVAVTPLGRFRFQRHIPGQRKSDLGVLFDPVYFTGGYAVHGSPSVPATPASHGCVRIPMWESKWFYDNVPIGTQMVLIKDGAPPVPTLPVAPPATVPTTVAPPTTAAPATTTTTARPTTTTTRPTTTTAPTVTLAPTTTSSTPPTTA